MSLRGVPPGQAKEAQWEVKCQRQGEGRWRRQRSRCKGAGLSAAGLGPQSLCAGGQLTSIGSIRMGSASWSVMASGGSTVTGILSEGAGSHNSPSISF